MAKLLAFKAPDYTSSCEIPEKVFTIDGYHVADRILEGIIFEVTFDDSGVTDVYIPDAYSKKLFEDTYNSARFYDEVKKYAEKKLATGDEVNIPKRLQDKYFVHKDDVAGIKP